VLTTSEAVPPDNAPNAQVGSGLPPPVILLQLRVTVLGSKPFSPVMVIVEAADPPAATDDGVSAVAARVKPGAACTTKPTEVVWLVAPDCPVMVTVSVPPGVAVVVEMVSVEVTGDAPGVTEVGLNEQLPPVGRPAEHDSATAALKPFSALTEMV